MSCLCFDCDHIDTDMNLLDGPTVPPHTRAHLRVFPLPLYTVLPYCGLCSATVFPCCGTVCGMSRRISRHSRQRFVRSQQSLLCTNYLLSSLNSLYFDFLPSSYTAAAPHCNPVHIHSSFIAQLYTYLSSFSYQANKAFQSFLFPYFNKSSSTFSSSSLSVMPDSSSLISYTAQHNMPAASIPSTLFISYSTIDYQYYSSTLNTATRPCACVSIHSHSDFQSYYCSCLTSSSATVSTVQSRLLNDVILPAIARYIGSCRHVCHSSDGTYGCYTNGTGSHMRLLDGILFLSRLINIAFAITYYHNTVILTGASTHEQHHGTTIVTTKRQHRRSVPLSSFTFRSHPLPFLPLLVCSFPSPVMSAGPSATGVLPDTLNSSSIDVPFHHYYSSNDAYFSYIQTHKAVALIADQVSLPATPVVTVPLQNILPGHLYSLYTTPGALLRSSESLCSVPPLHKPARAYTASDTEYIKLIRRLYELNMIDLLCQSQVKCVNGCFGVPKDNDQRMIIDAQNANSFFIDPPHTALPTPAHLAQLIVPTQSTLYIGKCDLSNFYHHIPLPTWLQPYFCLPPVTLQQLRIISSSLNHRLFSTPQQTLFYPCCLTMPMGFKHAVFMAQAIHEYILYTVPTRIKPSLFGLSHQTVQPLPVMPQQQFSDDALLSLHPTHNILNIDTPYLHQQMVVHALYIDDAGIISLNRGFSNEVFDLMLFCYMVVGFLVKLSKVVYPTADGVTLFGVDVNGTGPSPCVQPPIHKLLHLQLQTLMLLVRGCISGIDLAALIGSWTWFMLLRRPSLSYFRCVYRFIECASKKVYMLWPSVVRELFAICHIAPLLYADLTTSYFHRTIATDASTAGAGVTATVLTPSLLQQLSSLLLTPDHVYMIDPKVALQYDVDSEEQVTSTTGVSSASETLQPVFMDIAVRPAAVTVHHLRMLMAPSRSWYVISSYPWCFIEHINTLELRALYTALQWVVGQVHGPNSRVLCWVDNAAVCYIMRKGRSSANSIAPVLRKITTTLLASNVYANTCWLPSICNPADKPSRIWSRLANYNNNHSTSSSTHVDFIIRDSSTIHRSTFGIT